MQGKKASPEPWLPAQAVQPTGLPLRRNLQDKTWQPCRGRHTRFQPKPSSLLLLLQGCGVERCLAAQGLATVKQGRGSGPGQGEKLLFLAPATGTQVCSSSLPLKGFFLVACLLQPAAMRPTLLLGVHVCTRPCETSSGTLCPSGEPHLVCAVNVGIRPSQGYV